MDFPLFPIIRDNWLERIDSLNYPEWPGVKDKISETTREVEDDLLDFYEVKMADLVDATKTIAFLRYIAACLYGKMIFFQSELSKHDPRFKNGLPEKYGGDREPRLRVVK